MFVVSSIPWSMGGVTARSAALCCPVSKWEHLVWPNERQNAWDRILRLLRGVYGPALSLVSAPAALML